MKNNRSRPLITLSPCHLLTRSRRPRGTVIVLVVALLALLAVIGTVYVVSARTERASSAAGNQTVNLNLARQAIMSSALETMGRRLYGADGKLASYAATGTYGSLPANLYDYPDGNTPWLVGNLHNQSRPNVNSYSTLNTGATTGAWNPSLGTYSINPPVPFTYNVAIGGLTTVVGDQTLPATDGTSDDPPLNTPAAADAYMYLLPFSDASGVRYRYGLRILDTSRMANLNVGEVDNSADPTGIYLTTVNLAPPSGVWPTPNAYFSSADAPATTYLQSSLPANSGLGCAGLSSASYTGLSWQAQILRYEKPNDPALAFFDLSDELELRAYGEFGTSYQIRPATTSGSLTNYLLWPNTLSANPANPNSGIVVGNARRRNYTTYSWSRDMRPYSDPDLGHIYTITVADSFGTPQNYPTTPPGGRPANWPMSPAKISANPLTPISQRGGIDTIFYSVMAATNIATLMEFSTATKNFDQPAVTNPNFNDNSTSFSHEETCAFVANYLTSKWNGFAIDPLIAGASAYWLPAGPSLIDSTGICFRSATGNTAGTAVFRDFGNGSTDLHSETANKIYLGYSAQPFISEVVANEIDDDSGDGATPPTPPYTAVYHTAVELYNPYPVALSLNGYHLRNSDGTDFEFAASNPIPFVPANGYLIIESDNTFQAKGNNNGPIPGTAQIYVAGQKLQALKDGGSFTLYRPYYPRGTTTAAGASLAPVDHFDYTPLTALTGTPALPKASVVGLLRPENFSVSRPGGPSAQWSPTVNPSAAPSRTTTPTLGADNGGTAATSFPLLDRYAVSPPMPTQGAVFGMGEFARIIRLANEFDGSNATGTLLVPGGTNGGIVADHLATLAATTAPYANMTPTLQLDAQILFDFYADPRIYSVTPPSDSGIPAGQRHDIRATRLLEQITMLDRVSDFSIDIGNGGSDINKIRLPGQININTASGDVLRAIPNITDQMVANILAYRSRPAKPGAYTYNGKASTYDFSDSTKFPGKGIRSLAELLVAVTDPSSTALIDQRDLPWGPLCGAATVRSDTFVVYGYLEAIKQNPGFTGTFDNGNVWYGTGPSAMTDNPRDVNIANIPLLRVARRRWVAIVDRSLSNYSKVHTQFNPDGTIDPKAGQPDSRFALPRIMAIKDLPQ